MELRNITTFLRVAELQNFTHAALELGYSQSAVTVQIRQLETELGVPLFERIGGVAAHHRFSPAVPAGQCRRPHLHGRWPAGNDAPQRCRFHLLCG